MWLAKPFFLLLVLFLFCICGLRVWREVWHTTSATTVVAAMCAINHGAAAVGMVVRCQHKLCFFLLFLARF